MVMGAVSLIEPICWKREKSPLDVLELNSNLSLGWQRQRLSSLGDRALPRLTTSPYCHHCISGQMSWATH
jgi:hypothetical protein